MNALQVDVRAILSKNVRCLYPLHWGAFKRKYASI